MIYYKVLASDMGSCVANKRTIYIQNQWVSSPSVTQPLFVFNSLESARKFRDAYARVCYIYSAEVEGIVTYHESKDTFPSGTILACRVKILEKVEDECVTVEVGDVLLYGTTKMLVVCDWKYYGDHKFTKLILIGDEEQTFGEEWMMKPYSFKTLQDIKNQTGCELTKIGKFSDFFKKVL